MRNTKIVATLGPATDSEERIRQLIEAGVNVFRLNVSHGTQQEHGRRIQIVRKLSEELGMAPGILLDLQGPKIRLGLFERGGCNLPTGSLFTITTEEVTGTAECASISYSHFAKDVKPGNRVLIADGSVELRVLSTDGVAAHCKVVVGGFVGDRKGVNLPGVAVSSPALTKKDISNLRFGLESGIDLVALSFVRDRDDVLRLRAHLEEQKAKLPIVAKIEKPEAWNNVDEILEASDGVMVARGDLGVEVALEKVPHIQKSIIERARRQGKFVITATQMLESMVHSPVPTRAEVSDVANAIYDGTDAVMLSAETSTGKYPLEAVRMMARVATEAEASAASLGFRQLEYTREPSTAEIVADAANRAATIRPPKVIVTLTASGYTARLIARARPSMPVFAFTPSENVIRQLSVSYGIRPILAPKLDSSDQILGQLDRLLQEKGGLKAGDRVILVAGLPMAKMGATNTLMLHRVGEFK